MLFGVSGLFFIIITHRATPPGPPPAPAGRMHSKGKGISSAAMPYKRTPPSWCKTTAAEVTEMICKLARKGATPSSIGVSLRDSSGIPAVRSITGSKILRILKGAGLAPEIPEDLYFLIKKAVSIRKHLERSRKDKDGKFRWGYSSYYYYYYYMQSRSHESVSFMDAPAQW